MDENVQCLVLLGSGRSTCAPIKPARRCGQLQTADVRSTRCSSQGEPLKPNYAPQSERQAAMLTAKCWTTPRIRDTAFPAETECCTSRNSHLQHEFSLMYAIAVGCRFRSKIEQVVPVEK